MASDNKTLGLGLQGGGSHAAFTWGVIDRLLDEVEMGNLSIAAISGTSGGALNGAVCAYGLMDGPKVAKQLLKKLWDASSGQALWPVEPYRMLLPADSTERWNVDYSPTAIFLGMAEQICSPYWNPLLWDAVGEVIEQVITDFDRLNTPNRNGPKLFVCATNVNKTALRIFRSGENAQGEITPKALMASTWLPAAAKWDAPFQHHSSCIIVTCLRDSTLIRPKGPEKSWPVLRHPSRHRPRSRANKWRN